MKTYLFIAAISICTMGVKSKTQVGRYLYYKDKIDRVRKARNGALFIGREDSDKAKGILHMVRLNDADMMTRPDLAIHPEIV